MNLPSLIDTIDQLVVAADAKHLRLVSLSPRDLKHLVEAYKNLRDNEKRLILDCRRQSSEIATLKGRIRGLEADLELVQEVKGGRRL